MTGPRRAWAAAALAAALLAGSAEAQRSAEDSIFPLAEYRGADARALAVAHAGELRAIYDAVRRCTPELDFQRHGIGFRRPMGMTGIDPYFTVWTWLQWAPAPEGRDPAGRAADAFRRYAPKVLPQLVARELIRTDAKVGGYGLVLTWLKPGPTTDAPIGETLVTFLPKEAVAAFVSGETTFSDLLAQSRLRLFDGQTELPVPVLEIQDQDLSASPEPTC